jgi:hypothetical protein
MMLPFNGLKARQRRNGDWMPADKEAIAAQIEEGLNRRNGESSWMPRRQSASSGSAGPSGKKSIRSTRATFDVAVSESAKAVLSLM